MRPLCTTWTGYHLVVGSGDYRLRVSPVQAVQKFKEHPL